MKPSTDLALVLLGLIAWLVAGLLVIVSPTVEVKRNNGFESTPNLAAAGAACGFAVAGGLCLLGAALTSKDDNPPKPPPPAGPKADYRDAPG